MKKELLNFFKSCSNLPDISINDCSYNNLNYKIIYLIDMADIRRFNFEIKPFLNEANYQNLDYKYLGLCNRITDISNYNLEYLLYSGKILIFFNDYYYYFEYMTRPKRSITKSNLDPDDETSANEGLIEDLNTNITLIKRRLKTNNLIIKKYTLGLISKTDCAVFYLNNNYDKNEFLKIINIIENINKDSITSINDFSILYQDNELVPKTFLTSSPEIIVNTILNGRIVVMIDNSQIACVMPANFSTFTISKSYINTPKYYTVFNHLFIMIFIFIALFMMGLFIALMNFHTNVIPSNLLSNIKVTERGTSFPMFYEVLIVYFLFEFYRFATSRSPNNYIQNIIIILGGLFIGQNAIESGTIGATILFLTSISYIAVFTITNNIYLITSINIFRLFILLMSYFMGIIGFLISSLLTIFYLFKPSINSSYYLYPFIPFNKKAFLSFFKPNKNGVKNSYE